MISFLHLLADLLLHNIICTIFYWFDSTCSHLCIFLLAWYPMTSSVHHLAGLISHDLNLCIFLLACYHMNLSVCLLAGLISHNLICKSSCCFDITWLHLGIILLVCYHLTSSVHHLADLISHDIICASSCFISHFIYCENRKEIPSFCCSFFSLNKQW